MKIKYQGNETETGAATVAAFLDEIGIAAKGAIVELDGAILAADAAATTTLREGAELNVYKIVAGG
jgi:thiamine biosynthesis protein ThiS